MAVTSNPISDHKPGKGLSDKGRAKLVKRMQENRRQREALKAQRQPRRTVE